MATLKVHYDGWLALPSGLRQKLGVGSGDRLEADLVDGTIVLRPATKGRHPARREEGEEEAAGPAAAVTSETLPPTTTATPAKRKPGRPRKAVDAGELAPAPAPAPRKARGRPRKAGALAPAPEPVVRPVVNVGPARLLKKADLPPKAAPAEPAPPPADAPRRARGDAGSRFEERRPFRNVEVRKLGPGRAHNRPRGHSWPARAGPMGPSV
jgi:bifunctional DNA-binding transcriptional regulator/antitoxin component of YhaV-PrlF toxin-antitoxin module